MGDVRGHRPVMLVLATFSGHLELIQWARQRAVEAWGPVALESPLFDFDQTRYYQRTMGTRLKKLLLAFDKLIDPAELPARKHQTNRWEQQLAAQQAYGEVRPVNLDPGYLTEAKLVLASTKDRDHRIYLDQGIFAETTLYYRGGRWQTRPWTYPDYQRTDYHQFFTRCRDELRRRYATFNL